MKVWRVWLTLLLSSSLISCVRGCVMPGMVCVSCVYVCGLCVRYLPGIALHTVRILINTGCAIPVYQVSYQVVLVRFVFLSTGTCDLVLV